MFSLLAPSDAAIVQQVLRGRTERFSLLVKRYHPTLFGVAMAHLGNRADAEDMVQEAFLRAYTSLPKLREASKLGAWLVTITRNRCNDLLDRRRREVPLAADHAEGAEPSGAATFEARDLVWHGLDRLDPEAREMLLLYYFSQKDTREIATLLEISVEAARKRLQRAREQLGRELEHALGEQLRPKKSAVPVKRIMAALPPLSLTPEAHAAAGTALSGLGAYTGVAAMGVKFATAAAVILGAAGLGYVFWQAPQDGPATVAAAEAPEDAPAEERPLPEPVTSNAPIVAALDVEPGAPIPAESEAALASAAVARLSGTVVDLGGLPVEDAALKFLYGHELAATATTAANGSFDVDSIPFGNIRIQAERKGSFMMLDPNQITVEDARHLDNLVLVVPGYRDVVLRGRTVDSRGVPVAGASISVSGAAPWQGESAADGTFAAPYLTQTAQFLRVSHPKYAAVEMQGVSPSNEPIEIVLSDPAGLSGRVIDKATGHGIAGARILLRPEGRTVDLARAIASNEGELTGETGHFAIANAPTGHVTLLAIASGYVPLQLALPPLGEGELHPKLELAMSEAEPLTVRVEDMAGNPVQGARLFLGRLGSMNMNVPLLRLAAGRQPAAETNATGEAVLNEVPERPSAVHVMADGFGLGHATLPGAANVATAEPVVIRLEKEATIVGTVTINGEAPNRGSVVVSYPGRGNAARMNYAFGMGDVSPLPESALSQGAIDAMSATAYDPPTGTYRIPAVIPGTVLVEVATGDMLTRNTVRQSRQYEVAPGETLICDFNLVTGNSALEGTVTVAGAPYRSIITVTYTHEGETYRHNVPSDAQGIYYLAGLHAGAVSVEATGPYNTSMRLQTELLAGRVVRQDINQPAGASIAITATNLTPGSGVGIFLLEGTAEAPVLDAAGQQLLFEMRAPVTSGMDEDGDGIAVASLEGIQPGEYTLVAFAPTEMTGDDFSAAPMQVLYVTVEQDATQLDWHVEF